MKIGEVSGKSNFTVKTEVSISGLLIYLSCADETEFNKLLNARNLIEFEVVLKQGATNTTIVERMELDLACEALTGGDAPVYQFTDKYYIVFRLNWSGEEGSASLRMDRNSEYFINFFNTLTGTTVTVLGLEDESVTDYVNKIGKMRVNASEKKTVSTSSKEGQLIGVLLPIDAFAPDSNHEFELKFANGKNLNLSTHELHYLSLVDEPKTIGIHSTEPTELTYRNTHLYVDLVEHDEAVVEISIRNNAREDIQIITNTLTDI